MGRPPRILITRGLPYFIMKSGTIIAVLATGILLATGAVLTPFSAYIDDLSYDFCLNNTGLPGYPSERAVVIGIDDQSLDEFQEPLVLWHERIAEVIEFVSKAGASSISLDIIPSISLEAIAPEKDKRLIDALRKAKELGVPVYMGFKSGENGVMPHKKFSLFSSGVGFINLITDNDGRIRKHYAFTDTESGETIPSLSALAAGYKTNHIEKTEEFYIDYRIGKPDEMSFSSIFKISTGNPDPQIVEVLKGRNVFIGVTSPKLQDIHKVPYEGFVGKMPGVYIHAIASETLRSASLIKSLPAWSSILIIILIGIGIGYCFMILPPQKAVIWLVGLFTVGSAFILMSFKSGLVVPASPLIAGLIFPAAVSGSYRYISEHLLLKRLKRYFKSYVHSEVLEDIIRNPEGVCLGGKKIRVTILFSDIRDFTSMAENLDPGEVVNGLNRYFSEMTKAVRDSGGYLDKYIGDGILAVFGAPIEQTDHGALSAVQCGLRMRERLEEMNSDGIFKAGKDVSIGIGMHTGDAVIGNIGCHEKMDYSVIGDAVNLASRIEGLTKLYGYDILVSEDTYGIIADSVNAGFVEDAQVKGREKKVKIYRIDSLKGEAL